MTTISSSSWKEYLKNFSSSNKAFNEHIENYLKISIPSADRVSKIQNLSSDKGDSIIMYYSPVSKSMQFLHSVADIGSTNWHKDPILVALDGFKVAKANPVIFDMDSLFEEISCDAPLLNRLTSIATTEELDQTVPPTTNPETFNHLPFILLTPF